MFWQSKTNLSVIHLIKQLGQHYAYSNSGSLHGYSQLNCISVHPRHKSEFCSLYPCQVPLTSSVFPLSNSECHLLALACWDDNESLTPNAVTVMLESNGAVNCQLFRRLFPLCRAGWRVILKPWPVTSGERVKCSVWIGQCQTRLPTALSKNSCHLPASLPGDWASSMHQWHPPSHGRCSMPNQWFIRTQLAGRHGAACHMPWGSKAICTHFLLLYCEPHWSYNVYSLCLRVK